MNQVAKKIKIVIQGVSGAFHEIAARHYFTGHTVDVMPSKTFEELIAVVQDQKKSAVGIMAIENSIVGSILSNYSLIRHSNLIITGEVFLRIKQNLLSLKGQQISDLKEVHSHPMAIAQCQDFFKKFPQIKLIETDDNAGSAKSISENQLKQVGAIASSYAAEKYGLKILVPGIETNKQNFTRFLILERNLKDSFKAGCNKISISFSLKHKIGSLHNVLMALAEINANLTKIQSIPIVGQSWQYLFFVDFVLQEPVNKTEIFEIFTAHTEAFQLLGCYQTGNHYDD